MGEINKMQEGGAGCIGYINDCVSGADNSLSSYRTPRYALWGYSVR